MVGVGGISQTDVFSYGLVGCMAYAWRMGLRWNSLGLWLYYTL